MNELLEPSDYEKMPTIESRLRLFIKRNLKIIGANYNKDETTDSLIKRGMLNGII